MRGCRWFLVLLAALLVTGCGNADVDREGATSTAPEQGAVAADTPQDSLRLAEEALARAEAAERLADEALVQAQQALQRSRALLERLRRERRGAELTVSGVPPTDPARPRPPDDMVLDGEVVSFDAATGVVVLSLGAGTGVRQGYRLTISRGNRYVGVVEVDGVETDRSRGRMVEPLQKHEPQPGDRVQLR